MHVDHPMKRIGEPDEIAGAADLPRLPGRFVS